ncbi:MAG: IS1634 family transposase [Gammaproteobacteria bacterium]|nr:IS1634 family transposase [Gammaproteobacteria bacterium]
MFVRVKTTPNSPRKAVQLVESVRAGKTVRQRIVRHIGIALDGDELVRLKDLAEVVKAKLAADTQPQLFPPEDVAEQLIAARSRRDDAPLKVDLKQLIETQRLTSGIHAVYGAVYEALGLSRLLPAWRYRASHKALFHNVMARLANPDSKRASVRALAADFGVQVSLPQVYRMMDLLDADRIERLNALAGQQAKALLGGTLRVLFFDCTTLYFESFTEDALKQPGYSKDAKFKECQVLLALAVTETGLPVRYTVLPGATFEGHSLIPVVQALQAASEAEDAVVVADRGMLSEANLNALEAAGLHYIVGARLKSLPQSLQTQALDASGYETLKDGDGARVRELTHNTRRLVVGFSPVRAEKDRRDRDKALDKLRKKLAKSDNPKDLLSNRGYQQYLRIEGQSTLRVNPDKIAQAQRWDGLHGVITNLPKATKTATILDQYRGLWQVEDTFRVSKHDLKVRPIYHWTPRRIRAHIAIAFMSLLCVRHLQYRMTLQARPVSPEVIRNALVHVQHSVLEHKQTNRRYVIPSAISETGRQLYKAMGLTHSTTPYELK